MLTLKTIIVLYVQIYLVLCSSNLDYYELLGVSKTANNQEIRRAFKKLAVTLHPDKNQEDPDAHSRFIKLTRAYEVLKDDEKRKHYDITGEDSETASKPKFHSYTYYRDHFGIYDEDPQIITLSQTDFETNLEGSEKQWFINYYSPLCSHCHELAPIWRSLAKQLQGTLMFGAVNCEEDWNLCMEQGIRSYPSLVLYPNKENYKGDRTKFDLRDFILGRLDVDLTSIRSQRAWEEKKSSHDIWLLLLSEPVPLDKENRLIVAALLKGLLGVAVVDCRRVSCHEFQDKDPSNSVIYLEKKHDAWISIPVKSEDAQEIMKEVLDLLPNVMELDDIKFNDVTKELANGGKDPWLIYFHIGPATSLDLETKKLTAMLPKFEIGSLNCGRWSKICLDLSISRYPIFGVFKPGGGREYHHGPTLAVSVSGFAKESASATNLRTLNEKEFKSTVETQGAWFVDFYAPWCPPCMKLLPQLRKASLSFTSKIVNFATVDCTIEEELCRSHDIRSYPTTLLFNETRKPERFRGSHSVSGIIEFVTDMLNPIVMRLTEETFYTSVGQKHPNDIWVVDFFMPWCGPCQQLAPQYRKFAKLVAELSYVHVGEVNCEEETGLCEQQGVRSYPNIRLYPLKSKGLNTVALYSGFQRDALSLRQWLFSFMDSPVKHLTPQMFKNAVESNEPWLIEFFAPWCGHCIAFEPAFMTVAQKLGTKLSCGKLDCDAYYSTCKRHGISGYPTIRLYPKNEKIDKGVEINSQNPSAIVESVLEVLNDSKKRDEL